MSYKYEYLFSMKTGNLIINWATLCLYFSPTNILYLKDYPHNLTKDEIKGLQKSQFPHSSELEKDWLIFIEPISPSFS